MKKFILGMAFMMMAVFSLSAQQSNSFAAEDISTSSGSHSDKLNLSYINIPFCLKAEAGPLQEQKITISDGPSQGLFVINFLNKVVKANLYLYDALGNKIVSQSVIDSDHETFYLGPRSEGVYFLEVYSEGKSAVKRIVVEK